MINKKFLCLAILILLPIWLLPGLNEGVESAQSCVTSRCHAELSKLRNTHPVLQSCEKCHKEVGTPHPQKAEKTFKLVHEVPELCYGCHTPFGKKRYLHSPVKNGTCLSCHNPHGSDEPKLLVQKTKDLCTTCHADKMNFKYMHGPASMGDCSICHKPHESDTKALTVKDGADLCLICHLDIQTEMKKKVVHPALLNGCSSCHNPHGSSHKKLLAAEGEKLCFQCHPQISEKIAKSKVVHTPIKSEKGCASCHSPHASNGEKLLSKKGEDLCLDCHKNIVKRNMTTLHGPINNGTCTSCHDPHGSEYEEILVKEFPADLYLPYNEGRYSLCFSCHNSDAFRYPDTSFATGFRDGDKNLHYLHVSDKEKGRNCKLCHRLHGSSLPKLIAGSVKFGKWDLPLNFVKTDTGGSCLPGCHKKYSYDRKTPEKKPEPVKSLEKKGR
jgi:predicted CXXCH cytochrome family protein